MNPPKLDRRHRGTPASVVHDLHKRFVIFTIAGIAVSPPETAWPHRKAVASAYVSCRCVVLKFNGLGTCRSHAVTLPRSWQTLYLTAPLLLWCYIQPAKSLLKSKEREYRTVRSAIYIAAKLHDRVHENGGYTHIRCAKRTAGGGDTETLLSTEHVKDM